MANVMAVFKRITTALINQKRGKMNNKNVILSTIIGLVFIAAISVIIGWIFDITLLKSILPGFVTMKFSTALAFLISSIILLGISQIFGQLELKNKITIFCSIILFGFMSYILITSIVGINSIIENLIIKEASGAVMTTRPGLPSTATMINFVLIALSGLFAFSVYKNKILKLFGIAISILGISSILGYILDKPALYFYFKGVSSAMALHTAILFVLIGIAIYLLAKETTEKVNYTVRSNISLGYFIIIFLIMLMVGINFQINKLRLDKNNQIKDIEAPLGLMVEQVIGYDAMLTGAAHASLLHAQKGEFKQVKEHKRYYDEIGLKLDNLLKIELNSLLEKSKRPEEIKQEVYVILKRLDIVNIELVDMETRAFEAMEMNDTSTAYPLIVGGQYQKYKEELAELYQKWSNIETTYTFNLRTQIIDESDKLGKINMLFSVVILILSIILSFTTSNSISRPINNLKEEVDRITKGELDVQLSKTSLYELQNLTSALNRILASMKLAILRTGITKSELGIGDVIEAKNDAEDKYRILYESSDDAIMILEPPSWLFTAGNNATVKMFRAKDEKEFTSKSPAELSPEKQPEGQLSENKAKIMIEKAMKEGSNEFEWTHKRITGEEFPAFVRLNKIRINNKDALQATVRDLSTERQNEKIYHEIFNSASDPIFIHDFNGKFVEINDAACNKLGYTRKELLKLGPKNIDSAKYAKLVPKRISELKNKGRIIFDSAHITKKGIEIPVEINSSVITYKGKQAILSIARDISARKRNNIRTAIKRT